MFLSCSWTSGHWAGPATAIITSATATRVVVIKIYHKSVIQKKMIQAHLFLEKLIINPWPLTRCNKNRLKLSNYLRGRINEGEGECEGEGEGEGEGAGGRSSENKRCTLNSYRYSRWIIMWSANFMGGC